MPSDTANMVAMSKKGWPFFIARSKNKKLNLIVFDIDSLKKYDSIDTLIKRNKYRRFEFSEEQLNSKNWEIVIR